MANPVGIPFWETQGAGSTGLATSVRRGPSGRLLRLKPERREKPDLRVSIVPWIAYIIKSLSSGRYYKGSCKDISQRLHDHNAGRVKSTKSGRPWALHYNETLLSKTEALRRERFFKSRTGYRWLKDHDII